MSLLILVESKLPRLDRFRTKHIDCLWYCARRVTGWHNPIKTICSRERQQNFMSLAIKEKKFWCYTVSLPMYVYGIPKWFMTLFVDQLLIIMSRVPKNNFKTLKCAQRAVINVLITKPLDTERLLQTIKNPNRSTLVNSLHYPSPTSVPSLISHLLPTFLIHRNLRLTLTKTIEYPSLDNITYHCLCSPLQQTELKAEHLFSYANIHLNQTSKFYLP